MSPKYWPETLTQNLVAHYGKVHWSTLGRKNNRTVGRISGSTYPLTHYGQNMVLQLGTSGDLTPPRPDTPGSESPPQQSPAPVPAGGCMSPAVSGSTSTLGHAAPGQGGEAWERARESRGQWKGVISSSDQRLCLGSASEACGEARSAQRGCEHGQGTELRPQGKLFHS